MTQLRLDGAQPPRLAQPGPFLTRTQLRARGWTRHMVDSLLGEPDKSRPNPHNSRHPISLYSQPRIEALEKTTRFQHLLAKMGHAAQAAKLGVATKEANTLEWARTVKIQVTRLDDVVGQAIHNYNQRATGRRFEGREPGYWQPARRDSWPGFLERITVNFVRHQLTDYEALLVAKFGQVGVAEARRVVVWRVFRAISEAYPELGKECERQLANRLR